MWANTDFFVYVRCKKMADKRVSIVFDASMEVGKMKSAIDSINKSL